MSSQKLAHASKLVVPVVFQQRIVELAEFSVRCDDHG